MLFVILILEKQEQKLRKHSQIYQIIGKLKSNTIYISCTPILIGVPMKQSLLEVVGQN